MTTSVAAGGGRALPGAVLLASGWGRASEGTLGIIATVSLVPVGGEACRGRTPTLQGLGWVRKSGGVRLSCVNGNIL